MDVGDAIEMLAPAGIENLGPGTWADLGCGDGVFTRALASVLAVGSTIHAMDRDATALRTLPATYGGAAIQAHRGDFTRQPWPFSGLDGILMANSLHYVADQEAFVRACVARAPAKPRFLIVEYDTDAPNRWVPHPVSRTALARLFAAAGYPAIRVVGTRPSIYHRASLYAAAVF